MSESEWMIFWFIAAIVFAVVWGMGCKKIVSSKGYGESEQNIYFWLGFFLGLLGVFIAAIKSPNPNQSVNVPVSVPNPVDPVWKCSFCGTQNIGSEAYSRCSSCRHTRGESRRNMAKSNTNRLNDSISNNGLNNNNNVLTDLDALKKLKELLDMGAITQEEFDEKKAKLLK